MSQRVLRGTTATITATIVDQDGTPAAPGGTVTIDIARDDGTVIATGRTTTQSNDGAGNPIVGQYQATLTETGTLDLLACTWNVSATARTTTTVEIVGGYYFSLADARAFDPTLAEAGKYTDAQILAARREVEDEFEHIMQCAFVPRYRKFTIDTKGGRTVSVPDPEIRTIRSVVNRAVGWTLATITYSNTDLAQLIHWPSGRIDRADGFVFYPGTVTVAYEHGYDSPAPDLRHAALTRLRSVLNREKSGIPSNATSFTATAGGTYGLAQPGRAGFDTGIPEVDAVLHRYSRELTGGFA